MDKVPAVFQIPFQLLEVEQKWERKSSQLFSFCGKIGDSQTNKDKG